MEKMKVFVQWFQKEQMKPLVVVKERMPVVIRETKREAGEVIDNKLSDGFKGEKMCFAGDEFV